MNVRNYNVGASDYATHKYQVWDFWIYFQMNAFDGDILKRDLRHKSTDPREMDYRKIIHICSERLRQLDNNEFYISIRSDITNEEKINKFEEMIVDYNLCDNDYEIAKNLCLSVIPPYQLIIDLCKKQLEEN